MNYSNIAILKIKNVDYRCIITGISKSEAINLMQNIDLTEKSKTLKISYKFTRNSDLNKKKLKSYKLKQHVKFFESIYKNGKMW